MFDQAIQMGLPAIQTQHPGLYFEQAALHGRRRRQTAAALPLVSGVVKRPQLTVSDVLCVWCRSV